LFESQDYVIRKIKGDINETIIDFMLKELGFYVIKLGQEYKVEPIIQLEEFIREQNVDFQIFAKHKRNDGFEQIRNLPDFLIVKKNFRPILLEVKYRSNGLYFNRYNTHPKLDALFSFYNNSVLLLTCGYIDISKSKLIDLLKVCGSDINSVLISRFHIIYKKPNSKFITYCSFKDWLITKFIIKDSIKIKKIEYIIKKYEKLIDLFLKKN
jgi:hypothetical protein